MFDDFDKKDKAFLTVVVAMILAMILAITIPLTISYIHWSGCPTVTDKRFTAGYTETIVSNSEKVYIQHPDKYEVQLDGDDWVEVTEKEYNEFCINGAYDR